MSEQQQQQQKIDKTIKTAAMLGYLKADSQEISTKLKAQVPAGHTKALRDGISLGISKILDLQTHVVQSNLQGHWKFVHIIVTDGVDTSSRVPQFELLNQISNIRIQMPQLKTSFVGLGLSQQSKESLQNLATTGNGSFYNVESSKMESIFSKIALDLGLYPAKKAPSSKKNNLLQEEQDDENNLRMKEQLQPLTSTQDRLLVTFTLDGSQSMEGAKWKAVCNGVEEFTKQLLGEDDLVSIIVFNDKANCLTCTPTTSGLFLFKLVNSSQTLVRRANGFLCLLSASIMIVCAVYASSVEVNNTCQVSDNEDHPSIFSPDELTNVTGRYRTLLTLIATINAIDILRTFLSFKFGDQFAFLNFVLSLNFFPQLSALILIHVWRFDHGGLVCSGYYASDSELSLYSDLYLKKRSILLLGILITYWVNFALIVVVSLIARKQWKKKGMLKFDKTQYN